MESKLDINTPVDFENKVEGDKLVWSVCDDVLPSTTADSTGVDTGVAVELIAMQNSLLTIEVDDLPNDFIACSDANDDIDNSVDSRSAVLPDAVMSPALKVNDTVALSDPYNVKWTWRGVVTEVEDDNTVLVFWPERLSNGASPYERCQVSELRLVE